MGKFLLKVLLYICVLYIHVHTQIYLFMCKRMQWLCKCTIVPTIVQAGMCMHTVHHCAGRDAASTLNTTSTFSKTYRALLMSGTKMLWICPDLMFPFQLRAAASDPPECLFFFMYDIGTFVFLARWDQHPPLSDPFYHFPTSFVL